VKEPVSGSIVAVVGQEVVVKLPEHVQGGASVWSRHIVVGLAQHGIKVVEGEELLE